jgi:hypothetical protein
MKFAPVLAVWYVAAFGSFAGDGELEKILKDKVKCLVDVTAALKTVTDSKTAAAALKKVDAALERLIVCDEVLADPKVLDQLRKAKLHAKYDKPLAEATAALESEVSRLSKQPNVMKLIEQDGCWAQWQTVLQEQAKLHAAMEKNKIPIVKLEVKTLEQAVIAYYVKNGQYPPNLKVLAEKQGDGGPAYIKDSLLVDPWGHPYVLDANSRHPKTDIPLIYSNGPPGQNMPIRNWDPLEKVEQFKR